MCRHFTTVRYVCMTNKSSSSCHIELLVNNRHEKQSILCFCFCFLAQVKGQRFFHFWKSAADVHTACFIRQISLSEIIGLLLFSMQKTCGKSISTTFLMNLSQAQGWEGYFGNVIDYTLLVTALKNAISIVTISITLSKQCN